ncbi:ParB N-terminal domain-containing protein [Persicobacter diffluens]|uniref:ParB-like N-terminal domain-containing protein n=1 Tax=Persicobacter diffluens TaxID=981 RepID=A0AAN5ANG9_9BACT|nr:hypothetical protein PEDI_53490 [Persicobacter diffluens]
MAKGGFKLAKPVTKKNTETTEKKKSEISETLKAVPLEMEEYTTDNAPFDFHEDLKQFFPEQSEDEFEELVESVKEEGVREPLLLWKENGKTWLVDGHNRYRAAQASERPFKVTYLEKSSIQEVKHWMLQNQLGRRNLTKAQLKKFWTKIALENVQHGGDRKSQNRSFMTLEEVAEKVGASSRTIKRWMKEERESTLIKEEKQKAEQQKSLEEKTAEALSKILNKINKLVKDTEEGEMKVKILKDLSSWAENEIERIS